MFAGLAVIWAAAVGVGYADDPEAETVVYQNDFEEVLELDVWSHHQTLLKPAAGGRFLGEFPWTNTVTATFEELPEHQLVRLTCDLLLLKTIDGDNADGPNPEIGNPDAMSISVVGGPLLLVTTFQNPAEDDELRKAQPRQCFPDEYRFPRHPAGTGALRIVDLDFDGEAAGINDSIYRLDLVFPHTGAELTLRFEGSLSENGQNESWGLDNVCLATRKGATQLDDQVLQARWEDLEGEDPIAASKALWELVGAGPDAISFVEACWRDRVKARAAAARERADEVTERFEKTVAKFEDEAFRVRKDAEQAIEELGIDALPLVIEKLRVVQQPESRFILSRLKHKLEAKAEEAASTSHTALVESRVNHIRRIWECHWRDYAVTSSADGRNHYFSSAGAANDGYVPTGSGDWRVPRVDWRPAVGGPEWLQYELDAPKRFSSAAAFWYFDPRPERAGPPATWKVLYRDAQGNWAEVETKDAYGTERDIFNEVRFAPVTTTALRLALQSNEDVPVGLLEFRAVPDPEPPAEAADALDRVEEEQP